MAQTQRLFSCFWCCSSSKSGSVRGVYRAALSLSAVVATVLMLAPSAGAQNKPANNVADDGGSRQQGLGTGNLRLHPSLTLEGGYDTNLFYESNGEDPLDVFLVGVTPVLELSTRNPNKVDFKLKAELRYAQYVSQDDRVLNQRGLDAKADLSLTFNPNGAIAFRIYDNLTRTNESSNGASLGSFNRIYNEAGATLIIQPGGKLLTFDIGGNIGLFRHASTPDLDRTKAGVIFTGRWKFLPKTALVVNGSWDFIFYDQIDREIQAADPDEAAFLDPFVGAQGLKNTNSKPLRLQVGLKGLLLNRFGITLTAGYGQGFYDTGEDFGSFLANAELSYEIGPTSRFQLGYEHDFQDSSFGNFTVIDKGYLRYTQMFGGRLELKLESSFIYQQYAPVAVPILPDVSVDGMPGAPAFSTSERVDPIILGEGQLSYFFGDIFNVGARYQLDVNTSDFQLITGIVANEPNPDDLNASGVAVAQYFKHRVFLTVGVRW